MEPLDRIRAIYQAHPEVEERLSHGSPAWFWKGKRCLGMFADHHHGVDWVALWLPCPPGVAAALVAGEPPSQNLGPGKGGGEGSTKPDGQNPYLIPPYVGPKGWVGIRLGPETDWDDVAGLVDGAVGSANKR